MTALAQSRGATAAVIRQMRLLEFSGGRALIGCEPDAQSVAKLAQAPLADMFAKVTGAPVQVVFKPLDGPAPSAGARAPAGTSGAGPAAPRPDGAPIPGGPADHPLVRRAVEVLGAKVVRVQARAPDPDGASPAPPAPQGGR